jgi:hypothetical protein
MYVKDIFNICFINFFFHVFNVYRYLSILVNFLLYIQSHGVYKVNGIFVYKRAIGGSLHDPGAIS